jgi:hypothetical protein
MERFSLVGASAITVICNAAVSARGGCLRAHGKAGTWQKGTLIIDNCALSTQEA